MQSKMWGFVYSLQGFFVSPFIYEYSSHYAGNCQRFGSNSSRCIDKRKEGNEEGGEEKGKGQKMGFKIGKGKGGTIG